MFGRLEDAYGDNEPEYTILDCIEYQPRLQTTVR